MFVAGDALMGITAVSIASVADTWIESAAFVVFSVPAAYFSFVAAVFIAALVDVTPVFLF